jgi:two-component system chemotaxis sensor kinase CheA
MPDLEKNAIGEAESFEFNELAKDPELMGDFILETREHLATVELNLLAIDQDARNAEALHAIFRSFHTIKGLAGFLGLTPVQEVAHEVETVLDLARNGQITLAAHHIEVILASKDYLSQWMTLLGEMDSGRKPHAGLDNKDLVEAVRALAEFPSEPTPVPGEDGVAGALAGLPVIHEDGISTLPEPGEKQVSRTDGEAHLAESRSIRVDTRKLDFLVDMVGEMVIAQSLVKHDPGLTLTGKPRLARNLAQLARIT